MRSTQIKNRLRQLKSLKKRRPVVAYLTGNIHSDHPMGIVRCLYELFGREDIDVRYYLGTECVQYLEGIELEESRFDYQYLSLFEYTAFDDIDVLIIGFGTISIYHEGVDIRSFLSRMPQVPCIILENDTEIDGTVYLMVDNYEGMKSTVRHLITEHGCRRIGYVSGPIHNIEAETRLRAFRDTLEEYGLPCDERLIAYGDFSEHSDEAARQILEACVEIPDAIVSANDEMCSGIYRELNHLGLEVGRDILVTGFDDMEMAPFMLPPLTTVRQDLHLYGDMALERTLQYLRGEQPVSSYLMPELIVRKSCGCSAHVGRRDAVEKDEKNLLIDDVSALRKHQQRTWIGSLILRELLVESADSEAFFQKLALQMIYLNVSASLLCLLEEPVIVPENPASSPEAIISLPDTLCVPMVQAGKDSAAWSMEEAPRVSRGDLGGLLTGITPDQSFVFLLFYEQYQYGVLFVENLPEDIPFYYMLSMEIGSGLRYLYISKERELYRKQLQEQNEVLHYTAGHDALTNLLNRTGILLEMKDYKNERTGKKLVAMMADLDHLKQINDSFGHEAGDTALLAAADILREAIGPESLIGRTGGDEFMALFEKKEEPEAIRARIRALCDRHNEASSEPYYVDISSGFSIFTAPGGDGIRALFTSADEDLYRDKLNRRSDVRR